MTVWQLILLAVSIGSFAIGRYSGYHDGYVKGRKAVRKYYEKNGWPEASRPSVPR